MRINERYHGGESAFEGNRTLWLRSLPEGARVRRATLMLAPAEPPSGNLFEETIVFIGNQGDWGATRTTGLNFVEVDFHARRTPVSINTSVNPAAPLNLAVDIGGGVFMQITNEGGFVTNAGDTPMDIPAANNNSDTALPGLAVNKLRLTGGTNPSINEVVIRTVPTNVSAQLGQMPSFWLKLGEFTVPQTSPDFAEMLNIFLATAELKDGYYQIPLTIHSDSITRLDALLDIDFVLDKAVLPPHLSEITLPYNYSTLPGVEDVLTTSVLPLGAIPVSAEAQILGEFAPTRVAMGPIGETLHPVYTVEIKPGSGLAQPLRFDNEVAVTGIDLPLGNTAVGLAGMHISIQADADGKPFGDVLATAEVRIDKPLPNQSSWGSATLPSPFRLLPGVRYWLILQSLVGVAYWEVQAKPVNAEPPLQVSRNNGLSWRALVQPDMPEELAARFRLRNTPDRFSIPVQLQVGKGPDAVRRSLNEFAPIGRVDFSFDFADTLTEYLSKPGVTTPGCGAGDVLINGDFALPAPDDATFKLFGVQAASGPVITGADALPLTLDLSKQRMITLSVDGEPAQRIDVAGAVPQRTRPEEIVQAINEAVGQRVATISSDRLRLESRTDREEAGVQLYRWCDSQPPTGWTLESGHILRMYSEEQTNTSPVVLGLISPPALLIPVDRAEEGGAIFCFENLPDLNSTATTVISQSLSVNEGCTYALRIEYFPAAQPRQGRPPMTPGRWRVDWLDAAGHVVKSDTGTLEISQSRFQNDVISQRGRERLTEERHLTAPDTAVIARLQLRQAPMGVLALFNVAFEPATQALLNSHFEQYVTEWVAGERIVTALENWNIQGAVVVGPQDSVGIRLNPGVEDSRLTQISAVNGDQEYMLHLMAHRVGLLEDVEPLAAPVGARLELRWRDAAGAILGAPQIISLPLGDFPTHSWKGRSPAQATHAEIQIIQPTGDNAALLVESISLEQVQVVEVPIIFLAEAPGSLTLTNLRVAYDLPAPVSGLAAARQLATARLSSGMGRIPRDRISAPVIRVANALENLTVEFIAGVGPRALAALDRLGVRTIGELAALNVVEGVDGFPVEQQLELKAAAEMALDIKPAIDPFMAVADRNLDDLMRLSVAELAAVTGQPQAVATALQRQLRALNMLLIRDAFRSLSLSAWVA